MQCAGVDSADSYQELTNFIAVVSSQSSVTHFILHARKCLLRGLSPAENRSIPPLRCPARMKATAQLYSPHPERLAPPLAFDSLLLQMPHLCQTAVAATMF